MSVPSSNYFAAPFGTTSTTQSAQARGPLFGGGAKAGRTFGCAKADSVRFGHDEKPTGADEDVLFEQEAAPPTKGEKLKAGLKSALSNLLDKKALWHDTKVALLFTLATCWLPGSQLLTIPAVYAMYGAIRGYNGFMAGWHDPRGEQRANLNENLEV